MAAASALSLGTCPEATLREARALRDEARVLLAKGVNPRVERKRKRQSARLAAENTFDAVYRKWVGHRGLSLEEGRLSPKDYCPALVVSGLSVKAPEVTERSASVVWPGALGRISPVMLAKMSPAVGAVQSLSVWRPGDLTGKARFAPFQMMLAGGRDSSAVFRQDEVGLPCLGNCSRCINAGVNPKNLHRLGRR